jgi:hypothetical protein
MLKVAAAVLLGVPALILSAILATGVAIVDVRDGGPGGHHIVVPVPLLAAQVAAAFVPAHAEKVDLGEAAEHVAAAREILEALADCPDAELVRVEEPSTEVVVAKVGDELRVRVHDGNDDISVNVPLDVALEILPRDGGRLRASDVVGALRSARFTSIVDVRSGDDHVRISIW